MKATIVTGLAFGALVLAGCSASADDDDTFCAAYENIDAEFTMMSSTTTALASATTVYELHLAAEELVGEVTRIEAEFVTLKANTSDADVKDALDTFLQFAIEPLGDLAEAAVVLNDMEAFLITASNIQTTMAEHDSEMNEAVTVLDAYMGKTCPDSGS